MRLCYAAFFAGSVNLLGCTHGGLNDLEDRAPVDSNGQPEPAEGEFSTIFPSAIGFVEGGNQAMRFVTAGTQPPSLSTFEYGVDGTLVASSLVIDDRVPASSSVTMAVAGGDAGRVDGLIAVGGFGDKIELYEARTGAVGPLHIETLDTSSCAGGPFENVGERMTFGQTNVAGADATIDLIATDGERLIVFANIDGRPGPPPDCFVCSYPATERINGVAMIDHPVDNDIEADEIVVAVGVIGSGFGFFEIIRGVSISEDSGGVCKTTRTPELVHPVLEGAEDIGRQMVVEDFDGDANETEGVAFSLEAEGEVIVFLGIGGGSGPEGDPVRLDAVGPDEAFASVLAVGDVDDDDKIELLVGDPDVAFEGNEKSGVVHVFSLDGGSSTFGTPLRDSTPEANQRFGASIAVGEFALPIGVDEFQDLAIIGANQEVFTIFAQESTVDPRTL